MNLDDEIEPLDSGTGELEKRSRLILGSCIQGTELTLMVEVGYSS